MIILILANDAETFSSAYNTNAKWQSASQIKIKLKYKFLQIKSFWQIKKYSGVPYNMGITPKKGFLKIQMFDSFGHLIEHVVGSLHPNEDPMQIYCLTPTILCKDELVEP